jgi:hypothetical protein
MPVSTITNSRLGIVTTESLNSHNPMGMRNNQSLISNSN